MYALISQLTLVCNMQLNVLDDLAEAMKALDGKKELPCEYAGGVTIFFRPTPSWLPPGRYTRSIVAKDEL